MKATGIRLTLVGACFCFLSAPARAQVVIISDDGSSVVFESNSFPQEVEAPVESAPDKPSGKSTPRSEKLKKLEYDRRPSAIFAAWSKPLKPPADEEKKEENSSQAEKQAAPAGEKAEAAAEPTKDAAPADPEAVKKKAEEEEKKRKAKEEADQKAAEAKAIDAEMAALQRNVTLGDWTAVKTYLAGLSDDERKAGYAQILKSLQEGPKQKPQVVQQGQPYLETNRFSLEDVLGLADLAPKELEKKNLEALGKILRRALDQGHRLEGFLAGVLPRLDAEGFVPNRRQLALLLVHAKQPLSVEKLLPTAEDAEKANDREGLNLVARYSIAKYEEEKKITWLEAAWTATQAALVQGEISDEDKHEAIERAVDIAPKIRKELGQAWLDESFTHRPERGMEILGAIGSAASKALQSSPMDADKRKKLLELQTTAAKALLAAAPERAAQWERELALLADNWLHEALVSYQLDESTSLGPRRQRDSWGNYFYWDQRQMNQGNQASPIPTKDVLDSRPSDEWLARIEETLRPRFRMIFAQLFLKVGQEQLAFPFVEALAATHPEPAEELVREFLRVWTKNHDPNEERSRTNSYIFFYGFEERASGIPLTRSKQERNLRELGEWVARIRKLPVEFPVEEVATAFTKAHSTAEVYRLETIEGIFGPMAGLEPGTLAELAQKMRSNLADVWRDPAVQKDKKTNRHKKDIEAEVLRGYELARETVGGALEDHPESWELVLAQAALQHDENNYRHDLGKDPEFAGRREAAFGSFHRAADLYARGVESLEREKESSRVYELWFYAALGACELKDVDQEKVLATPEIPRIRAAILALPGERAERHVGLFANTLFTRMSNASPAAKFRYVREGLAITGDHPLAREAKGVFDYYSDLVTEIQLRGTIDGPDRVGHGQPFGLRVDIRHTKEIERESGGFGKYLQNQNAASFAWNYGRPPEDYRDKFETAAREALQEHFDVLSVTFNAPEAKSKADLEYGWRLTPYAYLLLKARGPEIDRVPPIRLDLDFLDTTGYAVIPVETSALPIDAQEDAGDARPYEELKLTQTLDERQAKDGKLLLEVKATALGLVPDLDAIVDLAAEGFDVVKRDDQGLSVVRFDEEGRGIVSERLWTISMRAQAGLAELPASFTFGKPKVDAKESEHFRYVDADLASVGDTVALEGEYGETSRAWMWWIPAGIAVIGIGWFASRRLARPKASAASRFRVPDPVTPFTVLGLLRDIERNDGLATKEKEELGTQIVRIERHYFVAPEVREDAEEPDLLAIAERWAGRAR